MPALRTSAVCKVAVGDSPGAYEDLRKILYFDVNSWTMYEDVSVNYLNLGDTNKTIHILSLYAETSRRIAPHVDLVRLYAERKQ